MRGPGVLLISLALALGTGCAASNDDLQANLVEGTPEVLADLLPEGTFSSKKHSNGGMLPASITDAELEAVENADGWDPRDTDPYYSFTSAPSDVAYLPGEFEPVQALLMAYPSGSSEHKNLYVDIITAASTAVSTIIVYVDSSSAANSLYSSLYYAGADLDKVHFLQMSLDTIWIRDFGPLVVATTNGGHRVIDMRYYYGRWDDDVAPTLLANAWNMPVSRPPLEAEGGNFQSDGAGRCITTTWMVEQNYTYGYTSQDVRNILKYYLGCQKTVILPALAGEGTGHVDMYVTITGPAQAIVGDYSVNDDPTNAQVADQGAAMLANAGFTVRRIPMPTNYDGVYRSYTNSLAVGNTVLVPVYSEDTRYQSQALSVFKQAYPYHKIVAIDSTDIIYWAGAIHCITMTVGS